MSRAAALALTGFIAVLAMAALAWSAGAALQQEPEVRRGQQVTICHATGNGKYVQNSPDVDSIVSDQGHGGHPEDIIPPFDYEPSGQDPGGSYPGLNWDDEGQAIWDNGCVEPDPPDPPESPGLQPGARRRHKGSVHAARERRDDRGGLPAEQDRSVQSRPLGRHRRLSGSVESGCRARSDRSPSGTVRTPTRATTSTESRSAARRAPSRTRSATGRSRTRLHPSCSM